MIQKVWILACFSIMLSVSTLYGSAGEEEEEIEYPPIFILDHNEDDDR